MKCLLVFLAAVAVPVAAADSFNRDYLEVGYFRGEVDDIFSTEFDGWEVQGVKAYGNWLVSGDYERIAFDPISLATIEGSLAVVPSDTTIRIGGGYRFGLIDGLELVPGAGLVRSRVDIDFRGYCLACDLADTSDSDSGYFVNLGLHGRLTDRLEMAFRHRFTNVRSERLNDWRIDLRYHFTPVLAAGIGYRDFEGDTALAASLRWHF